MIAAKVALLYLLLLGISTTPDEIWMARVIQGECTDCTEHLREAAYWLTDTLLNRMEHGWCDSVEDCAVNGFWGSSRFPYPSEDYVLLAQDAMDRDGRAAAFYALSYNDCVTHDIDTSEAIHAVGPLYFFAEDLDIAREESTSSVSEEVKGEEETR